SRSDRGWSECRAAAQSDISTLRRNGHFNLAATDETPPILQNRSAQMRLRHLPQNSLDLKKNAAP
ncbi:hypothetical protein, partial [Ciceribacter sp. RN22]|uniref:hypothetical protein n=1 Tax=Ciceribacter sp. RN22 TaxID=2954932 RepID=UPI002093AC2C